MKKGPTHKLQPKSSNWVSLANNDLCSNNSQTISTQPTQNTEKLEFNQEL
jgi:hypothetical protein